MDSTRLCCDSALTRSTRSTRLGRLDRVLIVRYIVIGGFSTPGGGCIYVFIGDDILGSFFTFLTWDGFYGKCCLLYMHGKWFSLPPRSEILKSSGRWTEKFKPMRRAGEVFGRRGGNRQLKQLSWGLRGLLERLSVAVIVLLICSISLFTTFKSNSTVIRSENQIGVDDLWATAASGGWRPSSAPRSDWPPPPNESNGYLRVRCNGGLNQQRTAICNAVLAARIMNATLVLPELDANAYWHDNSGFHGIYDVEHFVKSLRYDVRIVESLPEIHTHGKTKKMKAYQLRPPRDAPVSWYMTVALEKMKEHGAIYLTPFSHRLEEEIDNPEYQRLRCRVNYHALRFKPQIMKLSNTIVSKLRSQGHFMSIHLRFEMDMLSFAGCFDIFTPAEQKILKKYRKENFAEKELVYDERRAIGKCPLTPEEVGLILRAMGFDNSTRIYLAAGDLFGGERFMKPFRALFPHLENHSTVGPADELAENTRGLLGSAVDYMVCLLSDIFLPTYDGPSNFANNVMGHRLYYGFRTTIRPDRKALAPIFINREKGHTADFEEAVRRVMFNTKFGGPHKRVRPESFYTNSWPECFCQMSPKNPADKCPPENVVEVLNSRFQSEETEEIEGKKSSNRTDS
ncbi:GDP-fucose protein O-fucosyltransferase [Macleaya cordata]|uniref:O-fucosyltransferase family protein n=1 Tax=Macleaya cordata TaxID=56857 RepID=A0A200R630_MACCD|nr:GDP-fucose protein O-fucosyltransferase [Macleaya cordata]